MNKEIEELLNELKRRNERYNYCKNNDISFSDEDYKSYLLLSYIEQLEKEIKVKDEGIKAFTEDLCETTEKLEQLENNRDKAIEFIEEKRKVFEWYDTDLFYLESLLKGDSDDTR